MCIRTTELLTGSSSKQPNSRCFRLVLTTLSALVSVTVQIGLCPSRSEIRKIVLMAKFTEYSKFQRAQNKGKCVLELHIIYWYAGTSDLLVCRLNYLQVRVYVCLVNYMCQVSCHLVKHVLSMVAALPHRTRCTFS